MVKGKDMRGKVGGVRGVRKDQKMWRFLSEGEEQ